MRLDRRTTLKWMLAAAAVTPALRSGILGAEPADFPLTAHVPIGRGYGPDPELLKIYKPGELWALSFTPLQRQSATALCDLIIPADAQSPSASQVGVVEFIDEWISAPYAAHKEDRSVVLEGLTGESKLRFGKAFHELTSAQQRKICDAICYLPDAPPNLEKAAKFFARYRDLTTGGFYTTPEGRNDIRYTGNTPSPSFEGPPPAVLRKVGLL